MRAAIATTVRVDIGALVAALVWPAVLLILALAYRDAIRNTLYVAARRGFKLGLPGGWSFELPGAPEAQVRWLSGKMEVDLRRPVSSAAITDSTRAEFSAQLQEKSPAEYAKVELGQGQEWLSSRLYFMSLVLRRLRGLIAFVFVDAREELNDHFVGWARLDEVRWALASRFPSIERAFLEASCDLAAQTNTLVGRDKTLFAPRTSSPLIGLGTPYPEAPADLLASFLNHIQLRARPAPEQAAEWVELSPTPGLAAAPTMMYEHGQWLNAILVQDVLGSKLVTASIRENELLTKSDAEQARLIAAHEGHYLALVHDDGRFSRLIDRERLMRELALATLRQQS